MDFPNLYVRSSYSCNKTISVHLHSAIYTYRNSSTNDSVVGMFVGGEMIDEERRIGCDLLTQLGNHNTSLNNLAFLRADEGFTTSRAVLVQASGH